MEDNDVANLESGVLHVATPLAGGHDTQQLPQRVA